MSLPAFGIQKLGDFSYSAKRLSLVFTAASILHMLSGAAILTVSLILLSYIQRDPFNDSSVAATLLAFKPLELRAGIAVGAVVMATALLNVPGSLMNSRTILKSGSVFTVFAILATLTLGLSIWFVTLIERQEFLVFWSRQTPANSALVQDRFNCCGYLNSTTPQFIISKACPSADIAISKQGCFLPFQDFADRLLNKMFTTVFGLTAFGLVSLMTGLVLIKNISEMERFRAIDVKKNLA